MRTEKTMYDLILDFAQRDERIRAVYMNGSRTNPNVPKDCYQDFDIVYIVDDFESFLVDQRWIDVFGERFILQMPEAMRDPSGKGHFNWMMLFNDGNRLDLTLIPIQRLDLIEQDSLTIALLDKDHMLPHFPQANDQDYHIKAPSALYYHSCCNNFWWCLQNVAKGIARDELPYAMMMFHTIVREELHDMISWYIGAMTKFQVSAGKMGKYFKKHLPPSLYEQYLKTYSNCEVDAIWEAVFVACDLFEELAKHVGSHLQYPYSKEEAENMKLYLSNVKHAVYS